MDPILHFLPCLLTALALALAACQSDAPAPGASAASEDAASTQLVYIGTGSGNPEEGIYTLQFDPATGELTPINEVIPLLNPTFLALSPEAQFLYAISEASDAGTVSAYRIDAETGDLTFLNRQATGGAGPAYVSTDQTGQWVLVANYGSGSVALLPVDEGGRLQEAADVVQHDGSGPIQERQEGPHAHYFRVGPDNRYAYAVDLGIDQIRIYRLDAEQGNLQPAEAGEVEVDAGAGPRHLDFHPNGSYAYLVNELAGTVTAYARDAATGGLTALQTLSALPDDFDDHNQSADIHVHPSGRWLYVSNRGDYDSIAIFAIDEATGELTPAGHQTQNIRWPRNFAIDPAGQHLLVANRRADEVAVFRLDPETGQLTPTDHRVEIPEPTNVTFVVPAR